MIKTQHTMDEYLAKKYGSKPKKTKKPKIRDDYDHDITPRPSSSVLPAPVAAKPTSTGGGWKTLSGKKIDPVEERAEETVFRDTSGNVISVDDQISVLKQRQLEKEAAEIRKKENLTGAVQLQEAQRRREKEQQMKHKKVAIHADNKEYNEERQSRAIFADPAAKFGKAGSSAVVSNKSSNAFPSYAGSFPSNRFNIKPGCLWDGQDRSNGFEEKWLTRQDEIKRQADISYQNEVDF